MKQAVILAAGEGQRLRPFTVNRPKAMLAIAGKPIVQYVIESLAQNGIRNIVLVVGYKKEQVYDYFGSGEQFGVDITYVTQEDQLGTADALARSKALTDEEFLVLPGDNLIEANMIAQFIAVKPEAVLVKRISNPARYGVVSVEHGKMKCIEEKPSEAGSNIVNTGIYTFTRGIFDFIGPELDIPDVLNKMIANGQTINILETVDAWLDVVYPWDILTLNDAVLAQMQASSGGTIERGVSITGQVSIGKDTIIRSNSYIVGPVVIGEGCDIGPNSCLLPATSIGDNVVISSFTAIKNSVIGNDVSVGAGGIIQDSVIDRGCIIKERFTASSGQVEISINGEYHSVEVGAMIGEDCHLDSNVVSRPGVIVGNYSQIKAQKSISGQLPDRSLVF